MNPDESKHVKNANHLLAWRGYYLAGFAVAFAVTFHWGVAPVDFLACMLGLGVVAFGLLLLVWRCRIYLLDLAWTLLFIFVPRALTQRYGVESTAGLSQGFFLLWLLVALLLVLFTPSIRHFCRIPTGA